PQKDGGHPHGPAHAQRARWHAGKSVHDLRPGWRADLRRFMVGARGRPPRATSLGMRRLRLRVRDAGVLSGALAGEQAPAQADGFDQENGRFAGGGGLMPITRPPASIALPGRSIIQFTVSPLALAPVPTMDERAENTPRRGGASAVAGGWAGVVATGPTGVAVEAAVAGGATGATCRGASMATAGACGKPGGGAGA